MIVVKPVVSQIDHSFSFQVLISEKRSNLKYILTNGRGIITDLSKSTTKYLKTNLKLFLSLEIPIQTLCPSFCEYYWYLNNRSYSKEDRKLKNLKKLTFDAIEMARAEARLATQRKQESDPNEVKKSVQLLIHKAQTVEDLEEDQNPLQNLSKNFDGDYIANFRLDSNKKIESTLQKIRQNFDNIFHKRDQMVWFQDKVRKETKT